MKKKTTKPNEPELLNSTDEIEKVKRVNDELKMCLAEYAGENFKVAQMLLLLMKFNNDCIELICSSAPSLKFDDIVFELNKSLLDYRKIKTNQKEENE